MAAEMSTGVLAMAQTYQQKPAISMLVLRVEGDFLKKADGLTTFICEDGNIVKQMIREAAASGKPTTATLRSVGTNKDGDIVADFNITWSFKVKSS
jgi:hypothetical protein